MVKVPICGTYLDSLMMAIFAPNSMSVRPNALGPVPPGRINWVVRLESAYAQGQDGVQLHPWNGAPVELDRPARGSISTGVPSVLPKI